jgi:membrane-associated protein
MGPSLLATFVTSWIEKISGPWLYVVAGVLTFAETGTLLFIIPGEFTLILAGVAAGAGDLNVVLMVVIACAAAVAGDAFGFWLGDRFGQRVTTSRLGRRIGEANWLKAEDLIRRRRGLVVLFGRWIGFLRALMPAAAGMSNMNYKKDFLPWDLVGAISWASLCVLGGYKLGDNAERIVQYIGWAAGAAAILAVLYWFGKKRLDRKLLS